ncbi:hypothetical protein HPP92_021561 [Vanilla planifolia]|uniref:Uncharacterized protein n=1 Tax=Vanilla planifolia TaxID=51239 RepID=A0A835PZ32_VANPL|nr:hypothetical protein HPP92_021561 [Vanilla planifolia]
MAIDFPFSVNEPAAVWTAKPDVEAEEDGSVTPKAEENQLKAALVCPPAPRKLRPAKILAPPRGFFVAPKDLAAVFRASPRKKKRLC